MWCGVVWVVWCGLASRCDTLSKSSRCQSEFVNAMRGPMVAESPTGPKKSCGVTGESNIMSLLLGVGKLGELGLMLALWLSLDTSTSCGSRSKSSSRP